MFRFPIALLAAAFVACSDAGDELAVVETARVSGITHQSAVSGGEVIQMGASPVLVFGVVWCTNTGPDLDLHLGFTEDGSGPGSFTSILDGLQPGITYFVRAYATNARGTAYGRETVFTTLDRGEVTDIDGHTYATVFIGGQEWMAENLRVTAFNDQTPLNMGLSAAEWAESREGAFAAYNGDWDMAEAYGMLYNWFAVADERGLCPEGWRVPDEHEWNRLMNVVSGGPTEGGDRLKSCRQIHSPLGGACDTGEHPRWEAHDSHYGTDDYGFSALPGGYREHHGAYTALGFRGFWWTSTAYSETRAWRSYMGNYTGAVYRRTYDKTGGFSLRCIRDIEQPDAP